MKNFRQLLCIGALLISFSSCMTTKTYVGDIRNTIETSDDGKLQTYDKAKQFWVFWGLVPIGRSSVDTPKDGQCVITTKYKASDVLITALTGGLVSSYSLKTQVME